jgi:pre-60S factor REI1
MLHYKDEWHRSNLILKSKGKMPLTREQFDELKAQEAPKPEPEPVHEEEEEEFDPTKCRAIPNTECLFCGQTFETADLALAHMQSHGFRFCYPDNLTDVDGLMEYFGEKVGIGHCCINCSRQFGSMDAVRDHMRGKRHCAYEFDDELEDYYQPETAIVPVNYEIDEVGELHVNGKTYGHRKYMRYYRQRVPDVEDMAKGRRLALPGPTKPRESVSLATDAVARKREFFKQKYLSKRERRLVTKEYHPFADMRRGNAT